MREFVLNLHLITFVQILIAGAVATVWGIILIWRGKPFTDGFRSILYTVAISGVIQAALGGILYLFGCRPENMLHLVYGLIAFIGIPAAFAYASEDLSKRDMAVLAFASFAIAAAAWRAGATGFGGYCPP
ncbi:MAG TPA: hypothetical protein VKB76_16015 [Ktedonobacterales bacterium]|nr:hypothetical protein [Ktedonobacterales bacterium]